MARRHGRRRRSGRVEPRPHGQGRRRRGRPWQRPPGSPARVGGSPPCPSSVPIAHGASVELFVAVGVVVVAAVDAGEGGHGHDADGPTLYTWLLLVAQICFAFSSLFQLFFLFLALFCSFLWCLPLEEILGMKTLMNYLELEMASSLLFSSSGRVGFLSSSRGSCRVGSGYIVTHQIFFTKK